jgi:hypothetical protein
MPILSGIAAKDYISNLSRTLGVDDGSMVDEALAFYTVCYILNFIAVKLDAF